MVFLGCGAFSGLKSITDKMLGSQMGFGPSYGMLRKRSADDIAVQYEQRELDNVKHFQEYGFLPELIARFTRVVPFQPLGAEELGSILRNNVVADCRRELALAGIELEVEETVVDQVVEDAIERQVGARGLRSALLFHLEEVCFEAYSAPETRRVVLKMRDGEIVANTER